VALFYFPGRQIPLVALVKELLKKVELYFSIELMIFYTNDEFEPRFALIQNRFRFFLKDRGY